MYELQIYMLFEMGKIENLKKVNLAFKCKKSGEIGPQRRGFIIMADSCCGTAETNTTLQSNYLIIKNTFVKKIKKFEKKNC